MRHIGIVSDPPNGLVGVGPLVEVTLQAHPSLISSLAAKGQSISPEVVKLMVDTGAQRTVIESAIADRMGIAPHRFVPMIGVSQIAELCPAYWMQIGLAMQEGQQKAQVVFQAEVVGMKSPPSPSAHSGLLGRDFLAHVDLHYHGPHGTFELVHPAESGIVSTTSTGSRGKSAQEKASKKARRKARRAAQRRNR